MSQKGRTSPASSPNASLSALLTAANTALGKVFDQLPALVGILLFVYGACARSQKLVPQSGYYDEGILLSNAHFMLRGLWPYRDFYSNYPPGIFLLVATVWKVFGISAWAFRLVAIGIHGAIAITAGRLAGRIAGCRFSLLAMGLVSVWTGLVDLVPYAWFASLLCALVFVDALTLAQSRPSRRRYLLAGVAFGAVGCFRHDLFAYFAVATLLAWAQPRIVRRWLGYTRPARSELSWLLAGAAIALGLVWLPTVAIAGVNAPLRDLLIEQARYVQPARGLPMPRLMAFDSDTHLPVFMVNDFQGTIAMTAAGPALGLVLALGRRWLRLRNATASVFVGLICASVMPQMLHRTDTYHTFFTISPALILAAALVQAATRRAQWSPVKLVVASALIWVFVRPVERDFWPRRAWLTAGMQGSPSRRSSHRRGFYEWDKSLAPQRRAVLNYVEKHTAKDERVFFTNQNHESGEVNEVDLYFLADRLPGVRYTQYDPNLTTRPAVQQEMIASLERYKVRFVVESSLFVNSPDRPPSTPLDRYLSERFKPVQKHGVYTILQRVR